MTTKERLRELVESLDEDAAERVLLLLEAEVAPTAALTPEELKSLSRALAQSAAGEGVDTETFFARYLRS